MKAQQHTTTENGPLPSYLTEGVGNMVYGTIVGLIDGLYPDVSFKADLNTCIVSVTDAKLTKDLLTAFADGPSAMMTNMGLIMEISAAGQQFTENMDLGICQPVVDELQNIALSVPSVLLDYAKGIFANLPKHLLDVFGLSSVFDDLAAKNFESMGSDIASTIVTLSQ